MTQPRVKEGLLFNKSEANIGELSKDLHLSVQVESHGLSQWVNRLNPDGKEIRIMNSK